MILKLIKETRKKMIS